MKERRFRTPAHVNGWLSKVQKVVSWTDNTSKAPSYFSTRVPYPISLKLPACVSIHGPLQSFAYVPGDYVLSKPARLLEATKSLIKLTGRARFRIECRPERPKRSGPTFEVNYRDGKLFVQMETGLRFEEVEANRDLLKEFFAEFGVKAVIRKDSRFRDYYLEYGIKTGFLIYAPKNLRLKLEYPSGPHGLIPTRVEFVCQDDISKALAKLQKFIARHGWQAGEALVVFNAEFQEFTQQPGIAPQMIRLLNAAQLPCKKIDLDVWYTLGSWRDFPVLRDLRQMDPEPDGWVEVHILRIVLENGSPGFISVAGWPKTFKVSVWPEITNRPVNGVTDRDKMRGTFYAAWGKTLKKIR
jgi:hypothetical protein